MSATAPTLTDAITYTRSFANDNATANRMAPDDLSEYVDSARTVFPMGRKNIIAGTCKYIQDGGALTAKDPTDLAFGLFTTTGTPTKTLELYYNYQNYTDTEITQFIDQALTEMDFTESNLSTDGIVPATIPLSLFNAMAHIAAAYAVKVLMDKFAENFNATMEGTALEQSEIYKAYQASYKANIADGTRIRKEYWSNQTRSGRPFTSRARPCYPGNRQMPTR